MLFECISWFNKYMNAISLLYQTVTVLGQICLFRARPTSLPFSWFVLGVFVAVDCALNIYHLRTLKLDVPVELTALECYAASVLSVISLIGMSYLLLSQRKIETRLNKFLIALFGTELVLTGFAQLLTTFSNQANLTLITIALTVWRLAIQLQIIKYTFEVKATQAFFLLFSIIFAASIPLWIILGMNIQPQS